MKDNVKKLIIKGLWVAVILFIIRCAISIPQTTYGYWSCAGEVTSLTMVLIGIYEVYLWKYNPFEKIPRIMGSYTGTIEYNYLGNPGKKDAKIEIKQSLLYVSVKVITNEITSNSIASHFITENDGYVLYYTYITNPLSKYSRENPIQYGTCRLTMKSNVELQGTYWTNRQTIGDINFKRV
jgi:hypothetical protein